jgi:hypothetical protein
VSDPWSVYLAIAAAFLLAVGLLLAAAVRGRLAVSSLALLVVAVSVWVLGGIAVASGFHDADGFVDCRSACTGVHHAAAFGLLAPPLLIAVAAAGLIWALVGRRRARAAR